MNANQLTDILADEIYKLRAGKTKPQRTTAVALAAGKIIGVVRLQLDHAKTIGAVPLVPFMTVPKAAAKTLAAPKAKKKARH